MSLKSFIKKMGGEPMTKEQLIYQNKLRKLVKSGKLTVEEAHKRWKQKYNL